MYKLAECIVCGNMLNKINGEESCDICKSVYVLKEINNEVQAEIKTEGKYPREINNRNKIDKLKEQLRRLVNEIDEHQKSYNGRIFKDVDSNYLLGMFEVTYAELQEELKKNI